MYLPELTTLDVDGLDPRLPVVIPFAAIKGFFDPSVQFGLQFDPANATEDDEEGTQDAETEAAATGEDGDARSEATGEKVVSLDAFRKKP